MTARLEGLLAGSSATADLYPVLPEEAGAPQVVPGAGLVTAGSEVPGDGRVTLALPTELSLDPGLYSLVVNATLESGEPALTTQFLNIVAPRAVDRVGGADRFQTAAQLALTAFPDGAETVFVATGADHADALAAGPLAAQRGASILLTGATLPEPTVAAIQALAPERIVVLGGEQAVTEDVAAQLRQLADVERLSGTNRFATAAAVAGEQAEAQTVYIARGDVYADALAGGSAATATEGVVLLSGTERLADETAEALASGRYERAVLLGSEVALSAEVEAEVRTLLDDVQRIAGADRIETAERVIEFAYGQSASSYVVTAYNFPDALAAVPAAATSGAPLLLVGDAMTAETERQLLRRSTQEVTIVGGTASVSDAMREALVGFE